MAHLWTVGLLVAIALLHSSSDAPRRPPPIEQASAPVPEPPRASRRAPKRAPQQDQLAGKALTLPVQGVKRAQLRDTFHARRGASRAHKAIDIMAAWGTPVLAVDDGRIAKITSNRGGGLTLYQVDNSGRLVYYYAHLAGYAEGLREGQAVRSGDVIAYVGATGNAPEHAPHLHFAVLQLSQERRWWGGEAINPYPALARSAQTPRLEAAVPPPRMALAAALPASNSARSRANAPGATRSRLQ